MRAHARSTCAWRWRRPTTPTRPRACSSPSPAAPGRAASPSSRGSRRAHARAAARLPPGDARPARHRRRGAALPGAAARGGHLRPHRPAARHRRGVRAHRSARDRRFYSTADTVADLEALRVALGADKLTLDGVSYGTFVAERYAIAHPDRVAELVLDSVVPAAGLDGLEVDGMHETARVLRAVCRAQHCPGDPAADLAAVVRARHDGPGARRHARRAERRRAELPGRARRAARGPRRAPAAPRAARARRAPRPARAGAGAQPGAARRDAVRRHASPWGGAGAPLAGREARAAPRPRAATEPAPYDRATVVGNGYAQTCLRWPPTPRAGGAAHGRPAAGARRCCSPATATSRRRCRGRASRPRTRPHGKLVVVTRLGALGAVAGAPRRGPARRPALPAGPRYPRQEGAAPSSARARSRRGRRSRRARRAVRAADGVVRALCGKPSAMAQGPEGTLVDWLMACQQQPIDSSSRRFRPKR